MLRIITVLFLLLAGVVLVYATSLAPAEPAASPGRPPKVAAGPAQADRLLAHSWQTVKTMFR
ncbi:hypothetical protein MUN84_07210 [Hymenobacter sp. 5516J-16]|uniref:Uncharacterized protein n=1 Tax=Hymenobacter sublimis TaxID=2933777 RepID=A0ABY4J681_9BACT|nr:MULTISPECIES: hypothetical protein [Hymenobacter]UOQ78358.1 hypothetical protein MUN84_07210 [Hymenobacter sp. 5516J-16]UPL48336.1 hypothetical protein MWH26_14195 [Hymenobacter sublimis]